MGTGKTLNSYLPMTETAYYILLSLRQPRHGYGIIQHVEEITQGRIRLGSGTVYGTLTKMHRDGIITVFADEERKIIYKITDTGRELLEREVQRLKELYDNATK